MSTVKKQMRLPPLKYLRTRNASNKETNPCMTAMSTVLSCWASAGYNTAGCAAIEQTLRECMDAPKVTEAKRTNINFHLARMKPRVTSRAKQTGPRP